MKFILQRYSDDTNSTLGLMFKVLPEKLYWFMDTLEDEYRAVKVKGETRIPAMAYKLGIRKELTPLTKKYRERYKWFEYFIEVLNVPNFTGIYIHAGVNDKWTDGCILTGNGRIRTSQQSLIDHDAAMKKFYDEVYENLMDGDEVTLEIRDEQFLIK